MTKKGKKEADKKLAEEVKRRKAILRKAAGGEAPAVREARKKVKRAQRRQRRHKALVARHSKPAEAPKEA